jgi:hypothetical protein
MRHALTLMMIIMASALMAACGGKGKTTELGPATYSARVGSTVNLRTHGRAGYFADDDDADEDKRHTDPDDRALFHRGRAATAAETRAITDVVKKYIAVAAAEESAKACALVIGRLARGTGLGDAVPREYAAAPGSSVFRDKNCAEVEALLFQLDHRRLLAESAMVDVIGIRIAAHGALAILGFRATPERELRLQRERGKWKIDGLLDDELP